MDLPPATLVINGILIDFAGDRLRAADGSSIPLRPQSFAALRYLAVNANRLATKRELMEALWKDVAVTDDSLVQCVRDIRRALNDERHAILRTVPRRGYRLALPDLEPGASTEPSLKPSIAVLAFRSLTRGQAYFADGLVEEVTTHLSKIPGLFVIAAARPQSEVADLRETAAALGVRYLLDGSVRRAGRRLRITARLVEGASATQIWAGSFDGADADVFDLQDRLTEAIVGLIEPTVRRAEIDRARRKRPESLDAYDLYLQALPDAFSNAPGDCDRALARLERSLALDPGFLPAHAATAWCREQRYFRGGFDPADRAAALRHADSVLGVNADDPQAASIGAFVRANLTRDYDGAIEALDRALGLNPNSALAWGFSALVSAHSERHERAVEHAQRALRLSPPNDPLNYHPYCALGAHPPLRRPLRRFGRLRHPGHPCKPGLQHAPRLPCRRPRRPRRHRYRPARRAAPPRSRTTLLGLGLRADGAVPAAAHGGNRRRPDPGRTARDPGRLTPPPRTPRSGGALPRA